MRKPILSIIGLGKLGLPIAVGIASRGYRVIGVDKNHNIINLIHESQLLLLKEWKKKYEKALPYEKDLEGLLRVYGRHIVATDNIRVATRDSEITFIVVPTPSEKTGKFTNKYILGVCKEIGETLKTKKDFHLIVIISTVMPGSTGGEILETLEKYSGKKCGKDFGLCYNPSFIGLGNVINMFLNPEFVLIGESDKHSGDILEQFYKKVCGRKIPIKRMNFVNAEITKLALNTFTTTKMSFANSLAELCEKIPGGNVDVITDTLGSYSVIGPKCLKGGARYGGPCLPRDNKALVFAGKQYGVSLPIAEDNDEINDRITDRLADLILSKLPPKGKVVILGKAYKPDTNVSEESQGIKLYERLENKVEVEIYDPCVYRLDGDVIVITTPWREFKEIEPEDIKPNATIIDCWRILDGKKFKNYIALGINGHFTTKRK